MFVFVGKLFAPLAYPLGFATACWIGAALCRWRGHADLATRLTLCGVFLVLFFSQPWVGDSLTRSLEDDYVLLPVQEYPTADAIVVLGGATGAPVPPRIDVDVGGAFDRLLHGMRLWRAGKARYLILSGGVMPSLIGSDMSEARRLRQLALEYGVDEKALLLEEKSRSTRENALFTAPIIRQRGWNRVLLVTSARHMRRAVGVFEAEGIHVIPAPTDVIAVDRPATIGRILPDADALRASHMATKEYVGWLVYALRGWL